MNEPFHAPRYTNNAVFISSYWWRWLVKGVWLYFVYGAYNGVCTTFVLYNIFISFQEMITWVPVYDIYIDIDYYTVAAWAVELEMPRHTYCY